MRKLLLSLAFTVTLSGLWAQDFAPSQQAQGYLDAKNVTVDHATGLFHYRIPLYVLKSGDFELPITLNYVAKGVRVEDQPGLVGYNWSLNTGGVVTRTIRGGIADEEFGVTGIGYIYQNFGNDPTAAQIKSVNKREIDGESDIFTAAFNGRSVNFIIKRNGSSIVAEPLERTNVKIECEQQGSHYIINGWVITDENGNKYYFRQKEWSADIVREDAISANGVRGQSYISSWHITRIEPRNSDPIVYNYKATVNAVGEQDNVNSVIYKYEYETQYQYGSPMWRPVDFSKYRAEFNWAIDDAISQLNQNSVDMLNQYADIWFLLMNVNPTLWEIQQNISTNQRIMGQLSGLTDLNAASMDLYHYLHQLADATPAVASNLRYAANLVLAYMDEVEMFTAQQTCSGSLMTMRSPMLDNIVCSKTVKFDYQYSNDKYWLIKSIKVDDFTGSNMLNIDVSSAKLSFKDKNGVEFNRIKFDYHKETPSVDYIPDLWGFLKKWQNNTGYQFWPNVDSEASKIGSLSKITTSDNGEITIDYEPNVILDQYSSAGATANFGGIRIKSLTLTDPATNATDVVKYTYPYPGDVVFSQWYHVEDVHYSGFYDQLTHSRAKTQGNAFLNTGNNGVYYSYVEEEFVGKGKRTYLFFNPNRYMTSPDVPHRFWCNGLPLGTATYDNNGNLKTITKNRYEIDANPIEALGSCQSISGVYLGNWFSISNNAPKYLNTKSQIKAYEFYLDASQAPQNTPDFYISNNFTPRINEGPFPEQYWNLIYGGKVLLKSQEEYRIEGAYSSAPSINHFVATNLGTPFNKVEYVYENIENSTEPTRISTTDSRGEVYTSVIRRVCDMADVTGTITSMKLENILSPIVKQQTLKAGKLLNETVNIYESSLHDGKNYFGVTAEKSHVSATNPTVATISGKDNSWCQTGSYTTEKTINYTYGDEKYLPISITDKNDISTLCYDFSINAPIMEAKGYNNSYISASNSYFHTLEFSYYGEDIWFIESSDHFVQTYAFIKYIEQQSLSVQQREYLNSTDYVTVRKAIEGIATGLKYMDYPVFKTLYDALKANPSWLVGMANFMAPFLSHGFDSEVVLLPLRLLDYSSYFNEVTYAYVRIPKSLSVSVTQVSNSKLKLYVLSKEPWEAITYTVTHSGGTSTGSVQPASKSYWNVQALNINLEAYSNITSVKINSLPSAEIAYLALLPDDCEFEATSYNSDGTVFCKFNQTGQMERYEYDGAGRVIKVFDKDGNLLKENSYKVVLP